MNFCKSFGSVLYVGLRGIVCRESVEIGPYLACRRHDNLLLRSPWWACKQCATGAAAYPPVPVRRKRLRSTSVHLSCRARAKGGTADSPGLVTRAVSTRNNLPSLSFRKGLQHCELAHRLSMFALLPAPPRTVLANHWIPKGEHYACHGTFQPYGPSSASPELILTGTFFRSCPLIGNRCRRLVALSLPALCLASYHQSYA